MVALTAVHLRTCQSRSSENQRRRHLHGPRLLERILFAAGRGFGPPATTTAPLAADAVVAHRYTIEVSDDGQAFTTVLDKTRNTVTKYVEFDELPPTACRFVRLTLTGWPRNAATPLGIVEFAVFGKAVSPSAPPARGGPE
jgi:hypothetical protein